MAEIIANDASLDGAAVYSSSLSGRLCSRPSSASPY